MIILIYGLKKQSSRLVYKNLTDLSVGFTVKTKKHSRPSHRRSLLTRRHSRLNGSSSAFASS
jgi:hypothetical protein